MLTGVRTIIIPVRDYRKAIDFYVNKLGMTLTVNDPSIDRYEVATEGSKGPGICFSEEAGAAGGKTGIIFGTSDIQSTCEMLKSNGVKVTEPYKAHGKWWAGFKDPDGNSYGLSQE